MQIAGRTPTMTATTLSEMSGGRLVRGLGLTGPRAAEGWYGDPPTTVRWPRRQCYTAPYAGPDVNGARLDDLALVGSAAHVRDQLAAWREGPGSTLIIDASTEADLVTLAELVA